MQQKSTDVFLTASWEYLAMLNYEVDPEVLETVLPPYTSLDLYNGKALVSVVGFLFKNTRVLGLQWPGHTNFEEVNLRYYLKHFDGEKWKRGVGFVSEIVPRSFIATAANVLYNEHYRSARMFHLVKEEANKLVVEYNWKIRNREWNSIQIEAYTELQDIMPGTEEEFILEHYYGYNELNKSVTIEYEVQHPRWQVYPVKNFLLNADIAHLYGPAFVPFIQGVKPHSVFLAKGSAVTIRKPSRIKTAAVSLPTQH
jgi:hypothetical protein